MTMDSRRWMALLPSTCRFEGAIATEKSFDTAISQVLDAGSSWTGSKRFEFSCIRLSAFLFISYFQRPHR
ncbi:MAG TPA: hypothetical protein G4N95_09155 [Anaerolineae bacterium]|nr:hypothetical protein [Anaerolineae bacterium]